MIIQFFFNNNFMKMINFLSEILRFYVHKIIQNLKYYSKSLGFLLLFFFFEIKLNDFGINTPIENYIFLFNCIHSCNKAV